MSRNFSWFLRIILYIPLSIALFLTIAYSLIAARFEQNFNTCLAEVHFEQEQKTPRQVANFVGCLKAKGNFFTSYLMKEERLYQMVQPKIQCEFIGKWYVSEGYKEYWLTIDANSRFIIEPMMLMQNKMPNLVQEKGIWSAADKNTVIKFVDEEYFWPIHEYEVKWLSDRHFALTNILTDQYAYFYRNSPIDKTCSEQKTVNK